MRTRFVAYSRLGARRGVLPDVLTAEFVPAKNELSTLTLSYPWAMPTHEYLEGTCEVAFEYFHNNAWVEPKNGRFVLTSVDFDYLEEVQTRSFTFISIGEAIRGVYVYGTNGLPRNDDDKVQFASANAGSVMSHVWDYAVSRGWKGFAKTFTDKVDSSGKPWKTTLNISFADDTSLESILMYFVRSGLIDFEWDGRTLHVYNADTTMQRDLAAGQNPLRFNLSGGQIGVDSAPEMNDHENMATHVVVTGEEGLRWVFPTGAVLPEGRREVFLSYSGVDDEGTALILAGPTLVKYSNILKNTTRQFQLTSNTQKLPLVDYRIGDWVLVEKTEGQWERLQIFQLALTINQNGIQGFVSLGDKIDSLIERLNEAVQRVQGGTLNEGTERPEPSRFEPSAPTDLVVTTVTLADRRGIPQGVVGVNFTHDGKDIKGAYIDIDRYEIQARPVGGVWSTLFILEAPDQAGTYSWLATQDEEGNLLTYEFRVIAISNHQMISAPSKVVRLQMKRDITPPEVPLVPTVTVSFTTFEISTTHNLTNGNEQPNDYSHSVVQMATTATGPWEDVDVIRPPMTSAYVFGQGYSTRWFRLIAVDVEGNRSGPSPSASGTATKLVDTDLILSKIDAGKTQIINGGKMILDSGVLLSEYLSDAAEELEDAQQSLIDVAGRVKSAEDLLKDVGSLTYATGQTLRQKLVANDTAITNANTSITKLTDRVTPLEAGLNAVEVELPRLQTSINGKNGTTRSTANADRPGDFKLGDTWEKWTHLGVGGKLLQSWRHDGSKWVAEIMDATYLPLVDIGAGTFGELSGGRLIAGSVEAQHVLIGVSDSLIPNGAGEWGKAGAWSEGLVWNTNNKAPGFDGSFVSAGGTHVTKAVWFDVEPGVEYKFEVWLKASVADSVIFFEMRNQLGEQAAAWRAIPGVPSGATGSYPVGRYTVPTGWTKLVAVGVPTATTTRMRVGNVYFNHSDGAVRNATQYISGMRLTRRSDGSLIVNGSITGDHVNAESVGAKVGAFVKADIGNLVVTGNANLQTAVANKMFANIFATNRLTASQVLIGEGGNLLGDPNFLDPAGWNNGGSYIVKNAGRNSNNAYVVPASTTQAGGYYGSQDRDRQFSVVPDASYKLSAWVKPAQDMPAKGIGLYMKWSTPDSAASGKGFATPGNVGNAEVLPAGVWSQVTGILKLPSEAVKGFIGLYVQKEAAIEVAFSEPSVVQAVDQGLIVDNGILARHITASEEMSAKLGTFLKLDVGNLTATGTSTLATAVIENLWTNVVRSRMITTDMMLVGKGANLVPNGDLANGKNGWDNRFGIYSPDPNAVRIGFPASIWINGTQALNSPSFLVKGATKYKFKVHARGDVAGKSFYVQFVTDQAGVDSPYILVDQRTSLVNAPYEAEFEMPAGAVSGKLAIHGNHANGTSTTGYQWFAGFELHEMNAASLIVEGGIVTKHLTVTEDMTVKLLEAHKVEADEIDTNSLVSDTGFIGALTTKVLVADVIDGEMIKADAVDATKLDADAITAKHTITGAMFQTNIEANTGIKIDYTGLRAWNGSGQETLRVTRATGDVTVTGGTIQTTSALNRGIKLTSTSLAAYGLDGTPKFILDAVDGDAQFDSRVVFGQPVNPHWSIVPWESASQERAGIWLVQGSSSGIGGEETAGIYMDNANATFANPLIMRGMNGGGVNIYGRLNASDMYSGTIHHSGGNYELRGSNGSFFKSSVEFHARILYTGAPNTSMASNAHIASDGTIWKSSSASRFKVDAKPTEIPDSILDIKFSDWIDRSQVDQYAEVNASSRPLTEYDAQRLNAVNMSRVGGVIAEDVEEAAGSSAGLFVTYDELNRVEGVAYDRLAVAMVLKLAEKVEKMAAELAALKGDK